jgi:hypothetical protein
MCVTACILDSILLLASGEKTGKCYGRHAEVGCRRVMVDDDRSLLLLELNKGAGGFYPYRYRMARTRRLFIRL